MTRGLLSKILYQKRWFIIGWIIGFLAMGLFMVLMFPSLKDSQLDTVVKNLSPALQKVSGGTSSLHDIDDYIGGQVFALRMVMLSIIMSIILFVGLMIGDEKKGLLLTQLSLPLSRSRILLTKFLAALGIMLVTAIGMYAGTLIGLAIIGESANMMDLTKHVIGCMLIGLDFGMIVFLLGAGFGLRGLATGVATLLAFVSYLLSSLVAISDALKPFEKFSLFHYYQNPSPVSGTHALLFVGFALVCLIVGWIGFSRRDING